MTFSFRHFSFLIALYRFQHSLLHSSGFTSDIIPLPFSTHSNPSWENTLARWFAQLVQMLDVVSLFGFLICRHVGTPKHARNLSDWALSTVAPKSGIYPKCIFSKGCFEHAIVETPCQSPAEFAILLPNNSIPVVDPKCSKALHHSVEGLHQTRSSNLTTSTLGARKSGIDPKRVFRAWSVRTVLFMTSDGCGILLTDVGNSLITCPGRWTQDDSHGNL